MARDRETDGQTGETKTDRYRYRRTDRGRQRRTDTNTDGGDKDGQIQTNRQGETKTDIYRYRRTDRCWTR